jgi:hypothetical protein
MKKQPLPVKFMGINTIELRSKRLLKNHNIGRDKNHNFTENVGEFIKKTEEKINNSFLKKGKRRVYLTRLNPRNRKIKIKYVFNEDGDNDFMDLSILGMKGNRNIKIKFFVVYSFVLKLHKKMDDKDFFNVHNNSIKVFFNIGTVGKMKQDKLDNIEDEIRKKLYKIFIEEFNQREGNDNDAPN